MDFYIFRVDEYIMELMILYNKVKSFYEYSIKIFLGREKYFNFSLDEINKKVAKDFYEIRLG